MEFYQAYMVFDVMAETYVSDPVSYDGAERCMYRHLETMTSVRRKAVYRIDAVTTNEKPA